MYRSLEPAKPPGLRVAPSPPDAYAAPTPQLLTPAMLARMILRRKTLVVVCAMLFALCGLAWGMLVPAKYIAYAQLIIDPTDLRITDGSLRTPSQLPDAVVAQVENQVRVILSESVLKRLIAENKLDQDPEFNGTAPPSTFAMILSRLRSLVLRPDPARPDPELTTERTLSRLLDAKREERTYVVNVSAMTHEPGKSVQIADGLVNAYLAEAVDARDAVSKRIAGSLNARIAELKRDVEQAERRVEDYKRANNIVSAVGQNVIEQQLALANTRLGQAQQAVSQAQSRFDQTARAQKSGDSGAIPDALQSLAVTNLRNQLTDVQRRAGNLMATRGARHPDIIEIRAQEAAMRRALADELSRIVATSRTDLVRAKADEREMQRAFDALKNAVNVKSEASVRLRELERDAQASRSIYENFLSRSREVSELERVDSTNVRLISRATLPERRASPPRTLLLVLGGLMLGTCIGAGLAMVCGMIEGDIEKLTPRKRPSPGFAIVRA